jgi:hypothetical protein
MVILALLAALLGAVLGARFTVFVLIPGIACASMVAGVGWLLGGGGFGGPGFGSLLVNLLLLVICLQLGYLFGAALRLSLVSIDRGRDREALPHEHGRGV